MTNTNATATHLINAAASAVPTAQSPGHTFAGSPPGNLLGARRARVS